MAAVGRLHRKTIKRAFLEFVGGNASLARRDVMLNLRPATSDLTSGDITELVKLIGTSPTPACRKVAIVTNGNPRINAGRLTKLQAQNQRLQLSCFVDYNKAVAWLTDPRKPDAGDAELPLCCDYAP